jgi:protease I
MAAELAGRRIAVLATHGVEQVELEKPVEAVREAGADVDLISLEPGKIQAFQHLDKGDEFAVDRAISDADPEDYDALVLPGGVANPDFLRTDSRAVNFARAFVEQRKPVGVICHGPWTLVEADCLRDRTITSWPSLQTDIRNAGGKWVDKEVHVDDGLVSSRRPDDLPAFCSKIVEQFAHAGAAARG